MGRAKAHFLPYLSIFLFSIVSLSNARPFEHPTQWYLSAGSSLKNDNTISLEVSERLFDRTHLIMQTRYAAYDIEPFREEAELFIPQMTSVWEQACLVQIGSKNEKKAFMDLGFGYELRRYAYYDIFDESLDYFWEPSFIIPITFHLDSFFHHWDAASDIKIILELGSDSHSRTTMLTHQMLYLSKLDREIFLKFFAMHHYTYFNDYYFSSTNKCHFGFIIESLSS